MRISNHMRRDSKEILWCVLLAAAITWLCYLMIGCSMSRTNTNPPAKQQIENSPPRVATEPIPIEHVDVDQDGTISAAERRSLIGDQPSVLLAFGTIIGLVLLVSIVSAWTSAKWAPREKRPPRADTDNPDQADTLLTEQHHGTKDK